MSIARWAGTKPEADDPGDSSGAASLRTIADRLTRQAMADLGGMERFVKPGDVVWIKPNIGFRMVPEFAANTSPDVVATLVNLCIEAGAKQVRIGDNSCYGQSAAYPMSGIERAATEAGGEVVFLPEADFVACQIRGERLDSWPLAAPIIESDVVINVPVVKHHPLTGVTACLKNLMGVAGGDRNLWHEAIETCLCDLAAYLKPALNVVDAVRVMKRNGPIGGELGDVEFIGAVAAGVDMVALDAFAAEQLDLSPQQVPMLQTAARRGLGEMDYRKLIGGVTDVT